MDIRRQRLIKWRGSKGWRVASGNSAGVRVEISRLKRSFGALTVVDDVSIDVGPGEFLALLGPSGSGKTTILMTIAGFSEPDSGAVRIGGRDVTRLPPYARNIGMVFQKYALFPHMTVAQNIAFPLLQRGMPREQIRRRIAEVIELVGLSGLEDRSSVALSGGQQQRVALARALVYRPPVLLMDEPLGALDKKLREHLQVEIKDIQRITGTTVIFVTHDQNEALAMADRLAVLNQGRIEQIGTPEDLYDRPANSFVADFIGEANVLTGVAVGRIGASCQVRVGNGVIVSGVIASDDLTPPANSPAEIVVRPTRIRLQELDSQAPLSGVVISITYAGDSWAARLDVGAGVHLTARGPATVARPRPGDRLAIHWKDEDARVFPRHPDQSQA
jgi:spermidine/putrescine ABC transporter ATP-binding subunit